MLFILVADSLNRFLANAVQMMPAPVFLSPETIQYADDTLIICEAHPATLRIITHVLDAYAGLTGLKINRGKSCFVPISVPHSLVQVIRTILSSPSSNLPIRYLGLPLTVKKPRKVEFQPMLSAIQGKLEGWTSNLLSYGGRITLVKTVLSAMPLHYMQALKIPIGVMQHIDRMRRNFLWKGNGICRGINCLANWERVCALKTNGGLGVIDLACQNDALLTKWIWTMENNQTGLWANTIRRLYGITTAEQLRVPAQDASFFIKDLAIMVPFYSISVDRTSSEISWRWTSTRKFSCATAYTTMHDRGLRSPTQRRLWKIKVPMKVRIFIWLMLEDKILT